MVLHISELAARSGVPVSTLRYYERIGLVEPVGRADNGYRRYDESAVDRLAFIGRAKRLGMSLDEVTTLVEAWFAGDCQPVQERLRSFVAGRMAGLRAQIAEESAFERQLARILDRLTANDPTPGPCRADCGCDTDPGDGGALGPPVGCSLSDADATRRLVEWRELLDTATGVDRGAGWLRARFAPSPATLAGLAHLSGAETACCPQFTFQLEITATAVTFTMTVPIEDADVLEALTEQLRRRTPTGPRGR